MRIYLTGFMGCGKSTIGPIVANVLGYDFVDLDALIVARAGKPIPAIFANEGEPAFRAFEAAALRATGTRDQVVVALGGGALTVEHNLRWALAHGTVVYLRVSVNSLLPRLLKGRTVRPLILDETGEVLDEADLRDTIETMIQRRAPFYERASVIVDADNQRVGITVDAVVQALRHHQQA